MAETYAIEPAVPDATPITPQAYELRSKLVEFMRLAQSMNVVEEIPDDELSKLGTLVVREYEIDDQSRKEWKERAKRAMDIAKQVSKEKSYPWPNASNVQYPMITIAALQFAARAYPAICDGPKIVKCRVQGEDESGQKAAAAERVSEHMSYQLTKQLPEWEEDIDTALHQIPIVGCAFKKIYKDESSPAGFYSDLVSAFDLVVNANVKSLERAPRVTHKFKLYPHEIMERRRDGRFRDVELTGAEEEGEDTNAPHLFLEQHRFYDLDGDELPEPWIITVHEPTYKVVRVRAGYDPNKIDYDPQSGRVTRLPKVEYFVKIPFIPDPDGGYYDVGFGHLLDSLSNVIDTTINQMMDAGTLQNAGGGFAASGVDLGKGKSEVRLSPGKLKTVKVPGNDIRAGMVIPNFPGPSQVLFNLLGLLLEAAKDIAAIQDVLTGDVPRNQPVGTTMMQIEQGLKVFTAIYKRIFRALTREYRIIYEINKQSLDQEMYFRLTDDQTGVSQQDYQGDMDIEPVADPANVTDMQRMAKAQFVLEQVEKGNPHINPEEATRRALEAAKIDKVDDLIADPPQPDPGQQAVAEMAPMMAKAELEEKQIGNQSALIEIEHTRYKIMQISADLEGSGFRLTKEAAEADKAAADSQYRRAELGVNAEQPLPVPEPIVEEAFDAEYEPVFAEEELAGQMMPTEAGPFG